MDLSDAAAAFGSSVSGRGNPHAFDLSEVDFEYVERLTKKDSRKLSNIIRALEQDGGFPELLKACREKLSQIDPASAPLSSGPASRAEQAAVQSELAAWSAAEQAKDRALRDAAAAAARTKPAARTNLPVRGHADSAFEDAPKPAKPATVVSGGSKPISLGQELNPSTLLPAEIAAAALLEKEKGNECFRAREFEDAVAFYTRSLHLVPTDPAVLNNRALAFLKLKQPDAALNDASLVLQRDPGNWKALWRRGQVWEAKNFLERALDDFGAAQASWAKTPEAKALPEHPDMKKQRRKIEQTLLEQEPNHPYVQHLKPKGSAAAATTVKRTEEESKEQKVQEEPAKAFKRMAIAEVDDDEDEEEEEEEEEKAPEPKAAAPVAAAAPPAAAAPMRRMPIAEVDDDDDDDEDAEEVAIRKPAAAAAPAAAARPAASPPVAKPAKKPAEPAFQSRNGGVMIELVDDEEEEAAAAQEEAKKAAAAAKMASPAPAPSPVPSRSAAAASPAASSSAASPAPFLLPPVPSTAAAFQRDWADFRAESRSVNDKFAYVRRIDPVVLAKLVSAGGGLDSKVFGDLLAIVAQLYLHADLSRAVSLLQAMATAGRFTLTLGMTDSSTRAQLRQALEAVIARAEGGDSVEGVSVDAIKALSKKYT